MFGGESMKIVNVVKNSIWYDPRVRKQLQEYVQESIDIVGIGLDDNRTNYEENKKILCKITILKTINKKQKTLFGKIRRELIGNNSIYKEIIRENPDIIHANDLNALIPSYKAAKQLNCKVIYDSHEIFLENPWIADNKIVKCIWGIYEKYLIKRVDMVVCVSHAASAYLQSRYKIIAPLVVTNCVRSVQVIDKDLEKSEKLEVLNHGQFYGGRGYDIMIDAAEYLKDYSEIELVLRGFGNLENTLRKKVADYNINNVRFAPPVKVDELIPEAARAWVGLAITEANCLNFKFSISNKIFEYAAAGLPVIMSSIPEHIYLNQKYHFGLIIENDTAECLAATIVSLYKSPNLYASLKEGSRRLSNEITWEKEFARLIEIERGMMNE